jgi:DNA-binding NarL/FixJ family response regulator
MNRSKVLVLDHDSGFLTSLSGALTRKGTLPLDVEVSKSEPSTLKAPECDAIVCTVERKEEIDVLARLKKADRPMPIIVLLPSRNVALALHARESGMEAILPRDRDLATLGGLVRAAVENSILTKRISARSKELVQVSNEVRDLLGETLRVSRSLRARTPMPVVAPPILMLDADAELSPILQYSFERAGFKCPHIAGSVAEAIGYLSGAPPFQDRQRYPLPYLVLIHLNLPLGLGHELLEWLRSRADFHQTVVIVNVAGASPDEVRQAYAGGANSVVTRPTTPEGWRELAEAMRTFWVRMNV